MIHFKAHKIHNLNGNRQNCASVLTSVLTCRTSEICCSLQAYEETSHATALPPPHVQKLTPWLISESMAKPAEVVFTVLVVAQTTVKYQVNNVQIVDQFESDLWKHSLLVNSRFKIKCFQMTAKKQRINGSNISRQGIPDFECSNMEILAANW